MQEAQGSCTFEIHQHSRFHSLVVVECFSLLWGNLWHSLQLRRMQNKLKASPRSPPLSTEPHCTEDGKEPDKLFQFTPPHFLTAQYVNFPKARTVCSRSGEFGGFCQASNPLMDRWFVYAPKNAHKVFAVSCGA